MAREKALHADSLMGKTSQVQIASGRLNGIARMKRFMVHHLFIQLQAFANDTGNFDGRHS